MPTGLGFQVLLRAAHDAAATGKVLVDLGLGPLVRAEIEGDGVIEGIRFPIQYNTDRKRRLIGLRFFEGPAGRRQIIAEYSRTPLSRA